MTPSLSYAQTMVGTPFAFSPELIEVRGMAQPSAWRCLQSLVPIACGAAPPHATPTAQPPRRPLPRHAPLQDKPYNKKSDVWACGVVRACWAALQANWACRSGLHVALSGLHPAPLPFAGAIRAGDAAAPLPGQLRAGPGRQDPGGWLACWLDRWLAYWLACLHASWAGLSWKLL